MKLRDRLSAAYSALRGTGASVQNASDIANGTLSGSDLVKMGIFGPIGDTFGPPVTDSTAMQVGTVFACLEKLGGATSQLPIHEYTIDGGDRARVMPNSPLWWMLNESPDPRWTASAWKKWIVRCVKLRGDQHTEIIRRGATAVGLKPLHPDSVQVRTVGGRLRYDVIDEETKRIYGVDQDDMLHFTGFGFDGERSVSAIKWAARDAVASSLGATRYMGRTVSEGGMPRISLEYPNKLAPDSVKLLRESFGDTYGYGYGGKLPLVMSEGGKVNVLSIDPVDLELLATRKFDKQIICEVMGVPPILIGESEKTSSWGTGVEQITIGWLRFDIQPMLCGWEEELNRKLFKYSGRFVEFSTEALLRGDSKAQSDSFRAALGGPGSGDGWMTVNEVRKLKNLPRLVDSESDKPFRAQRATDAPSAASTSAATAQARMVEALAVMAGREQSPSVVNVAAPVVNVSQPAIEVKAGDTHVTLPEGLVKVENVVHTPAVSVGAVSVEVQPINAQRPTRQVITRDASGDIAEIVTQPVQD